MNKEIYDRKVVKSEILGAYGSISRFCQVIKKSWLNISREHLALCLGWHRNLCVFTMDRVIKWLNSWAKTDLNTLIPVQQYNHAMFIKKEIKKVL